MSHAEEWMEQALRDLEVAECLRAEGYHEWSVYASQQAAEKAVKAVRIALGSNVDELK